MYIYPTNFVLQLERLISIPVLGLLIAERGAGEAAFRDSLITHVMMSLLLTAMVFIPISVLVSKKLGKKSTYQICFVVLLIACLLVSGIGHLLPIELFLLLLVFAGIGVGFGYVAPFAMVPDTIEFDAVKTGERKEGAYYGMWTFFSKCGAALSIFISGLILNAGGYVANAVQTDTAKMAIRLIIGPLPAIIFICAVILVNFYPLDEKSYKKLMGQA